MLRPASELTLESFELLAVSFELRSCASAGGELFAWSYERGARVGAMSLDRLVGSDRLLVNS